MSKYIKQTDVLRIIDTYYGPYTTYHKINNLPTIEYEAPARGKWEEICWGNISFSKCSNCGSKVQWFLAKEFVYCPFCGVKMEGE